MARISFEMPGVPQEALQPVGVRVTSDGSKVFVALGGNFVGAISDTQAMWGYEASRTTPSGEKIPASAPYTFRKAGVSVIRATAGRGSVAPSTMARNSRE